MAELFTRQEVVKRCGHDVGDNPVITSAYGEVYVRLEEDVWAYVGTEYDVLQFKISNSTPTERAELETALATFWRGLGVI